jgi:hypothetical protein
MVVAHLSKGHSPVAAIRYRSGLHVEIDIQEPYRTEDISFELAHSDNGPLRGTWEDALDRYFNDGMFDSRDAIMPGELRRIGVARDHTSLFTQATLALSKDLEPHGYTLKIVFE